MNVWDWCWIDVSCRDYINATAASGLLHWSPPFGTASKKQYVNIDHHPNVLINEWQTVYIWVTTNYGDVLPNHLHCGPLLHALPWSSSYLHLPGACSWFSTVSISLQIIACRPENISLNIMLTLSLFIIALGCIWQMYVLQNEKKIATLQHNNGDIYIKLHQMLTLVRFCVLCSHAERNSNSTYMLYFKMFFLLLFKDVLIKNIYTLRKYISNTK